MIRKYFVRNLAIAFTIALSLLLTPVMDVFANQATLSFSVAPMGQSIVLVPGDTYYGSFDIINPNTGTEDINYNVEKHSFYVDENYDTIYDVEDSPILDWTTITSGETGIVHPNEKSTVFFRIDVPANTAAGGQYEAFNVIVRGLTDKTKEASQGLTVSETMIISHLVFAEIAGDTIRQGEITNIEVPSFLLSGNITGSAGIKNTGNIHGVAKYTLQVYPLFSDEEIYTNEEKPSTATILPDRTYYNEISWSDTPAFGIFNVIYTVEFEGVTQQVSKMVIKCPIWLLFIIIFAIAAIIIYFIMRAKSRKNSRRRIETE